MDIKKSEKARLENFSTLFFQLGLVLSLSIVYFSMEHKVQERSLDKLMDITTQQEVIEEIPITKRIEVIDQTPPPPPPPSPERIEIVDDQQEVEETVLEATEIDQNQAVNITKIEEITEKVEEEVIEEDIPFLKIEDAPIFPGCKGTRSEMKQCLKDNITQLVNKNFNSELSQELGLTPGVKRIFVQFRIDKTGSISDVKVRGPHVRLEKEAVRVVNLIPQMTPGKQRGIPVSVRYMLPITFKVVE